MAKWNSREKNTNDSKLVTLTGSSFQYKRARQFFGTSGVFKASSVWLPLLILTSFNHAFSSWRADVFSTSNIGTVLVASLPYEILYFEFILICSRKIKKRCIKFYLNQYLWCQPKFCSAPLSSTAGLLVLYQWIQILPICIHFLDHLLPCVHTLT